MAALATVAVLVSALLAVCSAGVAPQAHNRSNVAVSRSLRAADLECKSAGMQCTSCTQLSMCIQTSAGFSTIPIQDCSDTGLNCSPSEKACSDKASLCGNAQEFICYDEGVFPDPYHCNLYYKCGPMDTTTNVFPLTEEAMCPAGSAFNINTLECDLKDTDDVCKGTPVPICESGVVFSHGALASNPSYYYLCLGGQLQLYKCQKEGDYYDPDLYRCVTPEEPTTPTEEPTTTAHPLCPDTTRQPDPLSCTSYYDCSDPTVPSHRSCMIPKYFNRKKKKCVAGFCPYK